MKLLLPVPDKSGYRTLSHLSGFRVNQELASSDGIVTARNPLPRTKISEVELIRLSARQKQFFQFRSFGRQ